MVAPEISRGQPWRAALRVGAALKGCATSRASPEGLRYESGQPW